MTNEDVQMCSQLELLYLNERAPAWREDRDRERGREKSETNHLFILSIFQMLNKQSPRFGHYRGVSMPAFLRTKCRTK